MTHHMPPAALAADLRRLTVLELSLPARLRYVALLLGASALTAVVSALLLTEPELPLRTAIALGVMTAIGLSWMAFAAWVLMHKRILLGQQRVVASRMALVFVAYSLSAPCSLDTRRETVGLVGGRARTGDAARGTDDIHSRQTVIRTTVERPRGA